MLGKLKAKGRPSEKWASSAALSNPEARIAGVGPARPAWYDEKSEEKEYNGSFICNWHGIYAADAAAYYCLLINI
jgi:hypothetical protein